MHICNINTIYNNLVFTTSSGLAIYIDMADMSKKLLGTSKRCSIKPYYKNDVNNSDTKVENIVDNNSLNIK